MGSKIYPHAIAEAILATIGVDFDEVDNDSGGIIREQLRLLNLINALAPNLIKNTRTTIKRLDATDNKGDLNIAGQLRNTILGTITSDIAKTIYNDLPDNTMIKWLPSSADEMRPLHGLNYGKVMKLSHARVKGLGTDYGCQCGMEVIAKTKETKKLLNKLNEVIK